MYIHNRYSFITWVNPSTPPAGFKINQSFCNSALIYIHIYIYTYISVYMYVHKQYIIVHYLRKPVNAASRVQHQPVLLQQRVEILQAGDRFEAPSGIRFRMCI